MPIVRTVVRVIPLTTFHYRRLLPRPGRVVVNQGQRVKTSTVVAETLLEARYRVLDVAQALGVPRAAAEEWITCRVGESVSRGEALAEKKGLLSKVVYAPEDGKIVAISEGQILLQVYAQPWELKAGIPGVVTKVMPEQGVEISAAGALIDGVWGNGQQGYAPLHTLGPADRVLQVEDLGVEMRGLILVTGRVEDEEVLTAAENLPLRGLIVGGLHPGLLPLAGRLSFPLVVLDAFAARGMNAAAFRLLESSEERRAAVVAETPDPYTGRRPVVFIPAEEAEPEQVAPEAAALEPGVQVRLIREPHRGQTAVVVSLPQGWVTLPNGARALGAEVRLPSGERMMVPLTNLEILVQSS